jgi:hypothetical protein
MDYVGAKAAFVGRGLDMIDYVPRRNTVYLQIDGDRIAPITYDGELDDDKVDLIAKKFMQLYGKDHNEYWRKKWEREST